MITQSLARRVATLFVMGSFYAAIGEAPVRGGELQVGAAMRVITPESASAGLGRNGRTKPNS